MPTRLTEPVLGDGVEPDRARQILALRTRTLAMRGQTEAAQAGDAGQRIMACRLGTELFGLDVAAVAAVVPMGRHASLPSAPPAVLGLIGRAGRIYSVIDLAIALGLQGEASGMGQLLILRQETPRVALRVSQVLGVTALPADTATAPVSVRPGSISAQFTLPSGTLGGAEAAAHALVSMIDLDRLLRPFLSPLRPGDQSK